MNIKSISLIILLSISTFMTSCGYKEGVTSSERVSYLYFTGNAMGAKVSVDENIHFTVKKLGVNEQYKVFPGKHIIVVTQDGKVVVKRN